MKRNTTFPVPFTYTGPPPKQTSVEEAVEWLSILKATYVSLWSIDISQSPELHIKYLPTFTREKGTS